MADEVAHNVTARYLTKRNLQELLQRLFPDTADFKIRMRDDQWCFTAPRQVEDCEIE